VPALDEPLQELGQRAVAEQTDPGQKAKPAPRRQPAHQRRQGGVSGEVETFAGNKQPAGRQHR
jgi:hypothetical protein